MNGDGAVSGHPWETSRSHITYNHDFTRTLVFYNRAGVSKFYFRCFQNATGSSSAPRKVPELRIELEATIFHAEGPKIG